LKKKAKKNKYNRSSTIEDLPLLVRIEAEVSSPRGRMLISQLSLETHSRHVGRIVAKIEAEVSSLLGENAHYSALT
jgi:hypothetical protein